MIPGTLANRKREVTLAQTWEGLDGRDLVKEVTCQETYNWVDGTRIEWTPVPAGRNVEDEEAVIGDVASAQADTPLVVAYDFGIKHNILRRLTSHGLRVTVVPARMPAETVLAMNPAGVFLSNGPGDPAAVTCMIDNTLYQEGQSVGDFAIEKINPSAVIVKSAAYRFELRMQR